MECLEKQNGEFQLDDQGKLNKDPLQQPGRLVGSVGSDLCVLKKIVICQAILFPFQVPLNNA